MFLASVLLFSACESTPAELRHPERVVSHRPGRVALPVQVLDVDGEVLDHPVVATAVGDDTVARVGKDGSVTCRALGTSRVDFAVGELTGSLELRCLLISAIQPITQGLSLVVPDEEGAALRWNVVDLKGEVIEGVPVDITSLDPSIARIEGVRVYGVTTGRTRLRFSSGDLSAAIGVRVGKEILRRVAMPIPKAGADLPLVAGEWTLNISASAPVTVDVPGAVCPDTEADKVHYLVCRLPEASALHIEPTGLLREPAVAHVKGVFFPGS